MQRLWICEDEWWRKYKCIKSLWEHNMKLRFTNLVFTYKMLGAKASWATKRGGGS
jgi:hypothetical protein